MAARRTDAAYLADMRERNRAVLNGFFQAIDDAVELDDLGEPIPLGLKRGVHAGPSFWVRVYGADYVPSGASGTPFPPFVLWLSGCGTTDPTQGIQYTPLDVQERYSIVEETILGGSRAVLWQFQVTPNLDATSQAAPPEPRPCTAADPA